MRAGTMRHRVTLVTVTTAEESGGAGYTESESTATVWADVQPISGAEGVVAGAERAPLTHTVRMRYRSGVTPRSRIKLGSRVLYITSVANVGERNRELLLSCEERV